MQALPSVAALKDQLAGMQIAPPAHPLSPKQQSPRVKDFVKRLSPPKMPVGNESAAELVQLSEFYMQCKAKLSVAIQKLEDKKNRTEEDTQVLTKQKACVDSIVKTIAEIEFIKTQREASRHKLHEIREIARSRVEERRIMFDCKPEVEELIKQLNASDEARCTELNERLADINRIVQGLPSASTGIRTTATLGIYELWRLSPSTAIFVNNEVVQAVYPTAHDRNAGVDDIDTQNRFKTLFTLFLKCSSDPHAVPETTNWTYEGCKKWAEESVVDSSSVAVSRLGPLVRAASEKGENKSIVYNTKMERLLRSCAQSMFTGSLTAIDLLSRAPNTVDSKKYLHIAVTACGQNIRRYFKNDGSIKIEILLPCEMKSHEGEKRGETFARFFVMYTLQFDAEMNGISLACKASKAEYNPAALHS